MVPDFLIAPATVADAGEILTLQRAAFVSEAQLYDTPFLRPLTQTFQELATELRRVSCLKAVAGARIVGSGRAHGDLGRWHIGRLAVAPDQQGRGIGTALLAALEELAGDDIVKFLLFTGDRSDANLRLYGRLGYSQVWHERLPNGVGVIHMEKIRQTRIVRS